MSRSVEFDPALVLAPYAFGKPGHRLFVLYAASETDSIVLKIEKVQLASVTQALIQILSKLKGMSEVAKLPTSFPSEDPEWVAGGFDLVLDEETERVEMTVMEAADVDPAYARFIVDRPAASAFVIASTRLIEQGRPPCPFCGYPIDEEEHRCPRSNGHRAPAL